MRNYRQIVEHFIDQQNVLEVQQVHKANRTNEEENDKVDTDGKWSVSHVILIGRSKSVEVGIQSEYL